MTIILTLKDRAPFTYRWMQYMNDIRCPYKILIADGGSDKTIEDYLKNYSNYPLLNYDYVRYPYDENINTFIQKFRDVINKVNTPYLLFADNDDFYLLDNVSEMICFLDTHPDYSSCGGLDAKLEIRTGESYLRSNVQGDFYNTTINYKQVSIELENGIERMCYFMKNADRQSLWNYHYHILRTSDTQEIINKLNNIIFNEILVFEIFFHLLRMDKGKSKILGKLFYIRQEGTSQVTAEINQKNLVERFIINNTTGEIQEIFSTLFPDYSTEAIEEFFISFNHWFSGQHAWMIHDKKMQQDPGFLVKTYKNFRSLLKKNMLIYSLFQKARHKYGILSGKMIRVTAIEKYILRK